MAKQHEMNDADGDTTEYIHDPRSASVIAGQTRNIKLIPGKRHI